MKNIKTTFLITAIAITLIFIAIPSCAKHQLQWRHDGTVTNRAGKEIKADIQNVYKALEYQGAIYLIGYRIDKTGTNHPTAVGVDSDLEHPVYWWFENDLQDIFVYRQGVHLLDAAGSVFRLDKSKWTKAKFNLKPKSVVIDSKDDIIACSPLPLLMSSSQTGECYSLNHGWSITANWREITPKICVDHLIIHENIAGKHSAKKVETINGRVVSSTTLPSAAEDLCSIPF